MVGYAWEVWYFSHGCPGAVFCHQFFHIARNVYILRAVRSTLTAANAGIRSILGFHRLFLPFLIL